MTMAARLPIGIEKSLDGGPRVVKDHQVGKDGFVQRVLVQDHPVGEWDVGYGIRTMADFQLARDLFMTHQTAYAFRFFAPALDDHNAVGAVLGEGDGVETDFAFVKTWTAGARTYTKPIYALSGDVATVKLDGTPTAAWSLIKPSPVSGVHQAVVCRFDVAPGNGVIVTADFDFDTPVVFTNDWLRAAALTYSKGRLRGLRVREVPENPDL